MSQNYVDAGVKVFGWDSTVADNYEELGYRVETIGLDTLGTVGDKKITYKLNYINKSGETTLIDTVERQVKVIDEV